MAIRDKVTVKLMTGGKGHVFEVKRPGGEIIIDDTLPGLIRVMEVTRTGKPLNWSAFNPSEIKAIEFIKG